MSDAPTRILVVDDDPALRENLAEALEDEGFAVGLAESGPRALAALEAGPLPRIVLLDLVMPGMDGWELVRRIRADARWGSVRLVVTSGLADAEDEGQALADAFLPKPFRLERLLETLQAVRGE